MTAIVKTQVKRHWLKAWATMTSIALVVAVVLSLVPVGVSFDIGGMLSIGLQQVIAQELGTGDAVIYPKTITSDKEKLAACYSLVQQMIDEHNRVSAIAATDKAYECKFRTYQNEEFKPRLKYVLAERNRLIDKLIQDTYTEEEWKELSKDEEKLQAAYESFGDKSELKELSTEAECPPLDELKAIDITKLSSTSFEDPLEDFTTYTEVDPNSRITVATSKVTWAALTRNEDAYVYKDKGAAHFDGDFEHLLTFQGGACAVSSAVSAWTLANDIDDLNGLITANKSLLTLSNNNLTLDVPRVYLYERDTASGYLSALETLTKDVSYYLIIERDEAVGTYGTLYCYIYSDAIRETLVETLSIALHTSKKDFRYIYACQSSNSDKTDAQSGFVENLDLQEAPEISNTPSTYAFGTLEVSSTAVTGLDYFTITNTGSVTVDITIQGTDATGGDDTWTLNDSGSPGENIYALKAGLDGGDYTVIVKKTATYNTLKEDLAVDATQKWGLKLWMPTSLSGYDNNQMSATVTLVASASS